MPEPFQYSFFRNTGINLNIRFKRYFFARVEQFLAKETNMNMKHPADDLVTRKGHVNGFHIEHILSHNEDNLELFNGDIDLFEQERNRLGGLLLLKGLDNISSNNEIYAKKALKERYKLDLCPYDSFGPEELNARQKLLFEISSIIWK